MDKVHVLVTAPFIEEIHLARIAAVSPGLEVTDAKEAVLAELGVTLPEEMLGSRPAERKLTPKEASQELDRRLADTEVIFGLHLPKNLLSRAPNLRWIQGIGAGINHLAENAGIINSDIMVTNAHANSNVVAEYAIYLMLMLAKKAPSLFANKASHQWALLDITEMHGKTLGVVGLGAVGSRVVRLAHAFDMRVLATRRSVTSRESNVDGVEELFTPGELRQMLPECDFVILAVPLTPETAGIIGETEIRMMKPTSCIINVARGPIIKQDVLVRALREGWIAGAGLDVFEAEPLPPNNELWDLPNVIISPHLARITEREVPEVMELFCENLKRYLNKEELINLVDKARGY